jgi:head-tail adaptor
MRIIGPRKRFILIERTEGEETAEGQEITWTETDEFGGVINSLRGREGISYDKTGVVADYRLHTEYPNITEECRVKLKGTSRIFDVKYVDDRLLKNKIMVVDLFERKE